MSPVAKRKYRTCESLLEALESDYRLRGILDAKNASNFKRAKKDFGKFNARDLTAEDLDEYITQRRADKKGPKGEWIPGDAPATVNRTTQLLGQAFKLAVERGHLRRMPKIRRLSESGNVRQGVFAAEEMKNVLANLPDDGLRDFVEFAYSTGMRKGELEALRWSFAHGDKIIVPAGFCKNRKPQVIPIAGPLVQIMERRKAAKAVESNGTTQLSEYIFHRGDGLPVGDFKKSWKTACTASGCPNRIFHDLRRTSISDMIDAKVPQSVCMAISGHRTVSVFLRYAISSDEAKSDALEKTAEYRRGVAR